ncbi:MAG TPA: cytochrome P450 [Acidimicrobiales bacterium]|nr:cytochrome P450 [Acidimicrobiales bacterium]
MATVEVPAFNPFEPGFFEDPYSRYRTLRERDPVHHSPLGVWMLFRYDHILGLLRDPSLSVEPENATPTMRTQMFQEVAGERARRPRSILSLDPPDHTRLRRLVSKAFTPKRVESLRPRIQQLVDEALDAAAAKPTMDVVADLAYPLPFTVICELLGMPEGEREHIREASHTLAGTLDPVVAPADIEDALAASDLIRSYVSEVVAWKRAQPADDLLSALVEAEEEGDKLSERELLDQVVLLYIAGHETTVNLIGNGTLALLRHRAAYQELARDPALAVNAVEELLRYDSPVQFSRRITLVDLELGGQRIEAGSFVLTCLGSANHDPDRWGGDADDLSLTRPGAAQHLSFGNGIHHCLGAALARLEAQAALSALSRRFPAAELGDDPVAWNGRIVLRGLDRLPISLG